MSKLTLILGYLGTLPFVFIGASLFLNFQFSIYHYPIDERFLESAISLYALIIASFLAGTHWTHHVINNKQFTKNIAIISNVIVVFLWIAYLLITYKMYIFVISVCFVVLLAIDKLLKNNSIISDTYFNLRYFATLIVLLSLLFSVA